MLIARPNCALACKEIYFYTRSFHLQGILNNSNKQDKHIMKSGAPPDKVRNPAPSDTYRIPWFSQAELISKGYHSFVPGLISISYPWYGSL